MQALNPFQGDAILNLMEQCWVVTATSDQKQTHDHNARWRKALYDEDSPQVKEMTAQLQKATKVLLDLYSEALGLKVDDDILARVLEKNLPAFLVADFKQRGEDQIEGD